MIYIYRPNPRRRGSSWLLGLNTSEPRTTANFSLRVWPRQPAGNMSIVVSGYLIGPGGVYDFTSSPAGSVEVTVVRPAASAPSKEHKGGHRKGDHHAEDHRRKLLATNSTGFGSTSAVAAHGGVSQAQQSSLCCHRHSREPLRDGSPLPLPQMMMAAFLVLYPAGASLASLKERIAPGEEWTGLGKANALPCCCCCCCFHRPGAYRRDRLGLWGAASLLLKPLHPYFGEGTNGKGVHWWFIGHRAIMLLAFLLSGISFFIGLSFGDRAERYAGRIDPMHLGALCCPALPSHD